MPIDAEHLDRMTLGDEALKREILHIFDRQIALLGERIRQGAPAAVAAAAHTLKGSARGVGAWQIADAADAIESAASGGRDIAALAEALDHALTEGHVGIARLLAEM